MEESMSVRNIDGTCGFCGFKHEKVGDKLVFGFKMTTQADFVFKACEDCLESVVFLGKDSLAKED